MNAAKQHPEVASKQRESSERRAPHRENNGDNVFAALHSSAGNRAVADLLSRSSGRPLDPRTRQLMESRFGREFGDVRIHEDEAAGYAALRVGARAFISGHDIVFAPQFHASLTPDGLRLLAHELAHVVQQDERGASTVAEAEADAKQAASAVVSGKAASVHTSAAGQVQADPLTKEEIDKLIAENEAKAAETTDKAELQRLNEERNEWLARREEAAKAGSAASTQPETPPASPPPAPAPVVDAEEKRKQEDAEKQRAADAEELKKAGVTEEEARDYLTKTHGDVMDKHGFFRYWSIRSGTRKLSPGLLSRLMPPEDTTIYMFPSGRTGTLASERAQQVQEMQPPTGMGGIAIAAGEAYSYATMGEPLSLEDLKKVQQLGDTLEGVATGVAGIQQGRTAMQAVTRSPENQPARPNVTLSQQEPKAEAPPPQVNVNNLPRVNLQGTPANDVTPPNEPQSNVVPLFRNDEAQQQGSMKVAAGQDFTPSSPDAAVAAAGRGRGSTPTVVTPSVPTAPSGGAGGGPTRRPDLRTSTILQTWLNALKSGKGVVRDPNNPDEILEAPYYGKNGKLVYNWHMGHREGHEWWRLEQMYKAGCSLGTRLLSYTTIPLTINPSRRRKTLATNTRPEKIGSCPTASVLAGKGNGREYATA